MEFEFFLFHEIIETFFTENPKEVERQLKSRFKSYFEWRHNLFEIPESKISVLNEIFRNLKKLWGQGKIPLPFALIPPKKKGLFRPGRIYLSSQEAQKIEKQLKKAEGHLLPWGEFFELQLPESFQEEGLFPYRDLLLLGPFQPCAFCGQRWHSPQKCPNLKEKEAFGTLVKLLKKSPEDLLRWYAHLFEKQSFREALESIARRVFYFSPAFLELLITSGAKTWEALPLKTRLSRGGNLFLGLEAIRFGEIKKARQRLETLDINRDWQANLGLLLVSVLEEKNEEAFYYVEKALHLTEIPLAQAYLLLWKGWLLERERKNFEAEEAYQEALKRDRTFWPARLHLAACQVKYAREKARNILFPLLKEPLAFPLLLLEGRFLPFAPELEKAAQNFFEKKQEEAVAKLAQAENALRPIVKALPEEEIARFEEHLAQLRKEIYEGGFFEIISAEKKAFDLALELQGYLFRQSQKLREKYKFYQKKYEKFEFFGKQYPYRDAEDPFYRKLFDFKEELGKLARLLQQDPQRGLKSAFQRVKKLEDLSKALEEEEARLRKEWLFRKQLSAFVKVFLILEIFLFLIFLLVPGLYHFLGATNPPPVFRLSTFVGLSVLFLAISLFYSLRQKIEK